VDIDRDLQVNTALTDEEIAQFIINPRRRRVKWKIRMNLNEFQLVNGKLAKLLAF
jgi:hypothetical protein